MRRIVFTGGPGSGKSTLLDGLNVRGFPIVEESARAIIRERRNGGLSPRPSPKEFALQILRRDINNFSAPTTSKSRLFDRGILDALCMLDAAEHLLQSEIDAWIASYPYHRSVFFLPPWKEIYSNDAERDQSFDESVGVYEMLFRWYLRCGYQVIEVPRDSIEGRCDFVLREIGKIG